MARLRPARRRRIGAGSAAAQPARSGRPGAGACPASRHSDHPLVPGKLPEIVEETERALIAGGAPVFARGGTLVEPVCETRAAADGRKTITARLRPLSSEFATAADRRCRNLSALRPQARRWVDVDPPLQLVRTVLVGERNGLSRM